MSEFQPKPNMSEQNQLAVHTAPKASDQLASFLGIEKGMMLETLKAQCFKGKTPDQVSDAQLAAFVSTANVLQVNPLLPGMLYAYPERNGGITPILGPDGVFKKLDEMIGSGKLTGFECEVFMGADGKPERAEATIYRGETQKPAKYTAYFSEWVVPSNPNWASRPRHMIWTRAIKQAARQVIHGLPMDSDEYEISQMHNVTNSASTDTPAHERPAPKPRSPKGAATVRGNDAKVIDAVVETVTEATPTPEPTKVQSFADAAAASDAPKPAAAPAKADAPAAVEQRALLHPDESIEVVASIDAFKVVTGTRDGKPHKYITADIVSPELKGQVSQTDGGVDAAGNPLPVWQLDGPVRIKVRGKRFKSGATMNVVDSIELVEASAAGQQAVGDDV